MGPEGEDYGNIRLSPLLTCKLANVVIDYILPPRCDATVANDCELNPYKPSVLIKRYSLFCYHRGRKLLGLAIRKHLVYQRPYQDCLEKKSKLEKSSCFSQYVHSPFHASIKELGWCASRFGSDKLPNRNLGIIVLQLMKSWKIFLSVLGWGKVLLGPHDIFSFSCAILPYFCCLFPICRILESPG